MFQVKEMVLYQVIIHCTHCENFFHIIVVENSDGNPAGGLIKKFSKYKARLLSEALESPIITDVCPLCDEHAHDNLN